MTSRISIVCALICVASMVFSGTLAVSLALEKADRSSARQMCVQKNRGML